ncbi:MAG: diguanylate cyclase [Sphingomonas sp.]|uniref:GGDEF domain-containing protein n=1 Tax=Sphingomonas sp. TaxID=28214 RepID=UPI00260436AC|nr:diguanylate cyclase [Sphingomonas sp.]MDK2769687.1 diguanylate cyclase [Sphingomonas sp.]
MSIATRTAITLSALIGLIFVLAGIVSYQDSARRTRDSGLATLDHYAHEVAQQQEARFARIRATHNRASDLLRAELSANPRLDDPAAFATLFPADPRGGRRSADALYTGASTPFGHIRTLGGFIPQEPEADERRRLMAATGIVSRLGEGVSPELESLYYFTPHNALVIFAANRPDGLRFYRKDAPSSFDFQQQEFATITTRAVNPARTMRCTALRHILYDRTGGTWTTGCMTPVDIGGRHVGSWGTSVPLDDLLPAHGLNGLPGTGVILISREGRLIHHPSYTHQKRSGPESMLDLTTTRDPQLAALWAFVQQHRKDGYLGEALDSFVAMRRIDTPGWYALVVQDPAVMQAESYRLILRIALTAAVCLVLQALAITWLLRRRVGQPLARLIERTRTLTRRVPSARFVDVDRVARRDEVAQLTHDFDVMAERIGSAQSELERKVTERTKALRRANLQLKLIATRDPLTGIPNRRYLASEVDARLDVLGNDGHYLLVFDIDHLQRINAAHGEENGDRALITIANGIAALLRDGDLCARIDGAKFAAFIRADTQAEAMNVAERVRTGLYGLETPGRYGEMIRVTVSAGVTGATAGDRFDSLLLRADAALAEAKSGGRDRAVWHRPIGRRHNPMQRSG